MAMLFVKKEGYKEMTCTRTCNSVCISIIRKRREPKKSLIRLIYAGKFNIQTITPERALNLMNIAFPIIIKVTRDD